MQQTHSEVFLSLWTDHTHPCYTNTKYKYNPNDLHPEFDRKSFKFLHRKNDN